MFVLTESLLLAFAVYAAMGAGFAIAFAARGAQAIDPAGHGMPMTVRLMILPGAAVLWPLLLLKWLRRQQPPLA